MTSRSYPRGTEFPNEGFVQIAIERHFKCRGFKILRSRDPDLECEHLETGERWLIEAKGETSNIGLDFRTGIGQLVQRMRSPNVRYGLAIPDTLQFRKQCRQVSERISQCLLLHWLIVGPEGEVEFVDPGAIMR